MTRNGAKWLGRKALWAWAVFVVALGLAAACNDVDAPRITEETVDTLQDSIKYGD